MNQETSKIRKFQRLTKAFPFWAMPHRTLAKLYWQQARVTEAIPPLRRAFDLRPDNRQTTVDLVQALHQTGRHDEIEATLAGKPFHIGIFWRLLGTLVRARYNTDGSVANMPMLARLFSRPIRLSLEAMDRIRLRAELLVGIVGDEAGFIRLLGARRMIQNDLIKCLGLSDAPVRYMSNYWVRKIGHIGQIEFYFKPLTLGLIPPHRLIVLCSEPGEVANLCLLGYWKKYIEVIIDSAVAAQRELEARILDVDIHLFERADRAVPYFYHKQAAALAWQQWTSEQRPPLFSLDPDHARRGWESLDKAGMPKGAWFVALHIRESGFAGDKVSPRNALIDSYMPAIRAVIARGGFVVRLGDSGMTPLSALPGLLDYPHTDLKSDWMDVFLMAACRFFVGVASGPASIPPLFGVPCVYTNWMPMADFPYNADAILVHKAHRDRSTNEKAPYSRFVAICSDHGHAIDAANLRLEENTPDEIHDAVCEMLDRLDGNLADDQDNERRQARFRALAAMRTGIGRPTLGRRFLESNADILS
jgi:putative glycosyltransferase (TIGR04372 family)